MQIWELLINRCSSFYFEERGKKMKLDYFKDKIFDLLNDAEHMNIKNIVTNDKEDRFTILIQDGTVFEINCRQLRAPIGQNIRVCWRINNSREL